MNSTSKTASSLSLRASPYIRSIEAKLNLPGALSRAGYLSVFDIARQPKSQFVRRNRGLLKKQSESAYDLALGLANQLRRAFRQKQLAAGVQSLRPRTLSGQLALPTPQNSLKQGLMTGGPSWQTQFNDDWSAYCQNGAPEANDSPVAYLSWLYSQALSFERSAGDAKLDVITLADRRPDLSSLLIDDAAINQVVPSLQLVNQILEGVIAHTISDSTVDETLATTRYPSPLPYHYPHDQVHLSLNTAGVPLWEVIGQTDISWPYFISSSMTGESSEQALALASLLAPEQQTIVTEPTHAASSDFYKANFGYDTADYIPFATPNLLARQTGITVPQLEALLAGTSEGTSVLASPNVNDTDANASLYGAAFINMGSTPPVEISPYHAIDTKTLTDEKSSATPAIANNAVFSTPGQFNGGIILDGRSKPEFYLNYDLSFAGSKLMPYSLVFWCKVANGEGKNLCIITTNKATSDPEGEQGIAALLTVGESGNYYILLNITDSNKQSFENTLAFPPDQWVLVAITLDPDVSPGTLTLYVGTSGSTSCESVSISLSNLGPVTSSQGVWGFNGNKGNTYYNSFPDRWGTVSYDDITVWGRCLQKDEINGFITANSSGGNYSTMSHYYLLDTDEPPSLPYSLLNLSDNRMDRINRMVRLQRWLDIPYEHVDLLLSACIHAQGENNTDFLSNTHTLRMLGAFRHFQKKYQITAFQFAALIDKITPYAISPNVPFFDRIFNSPSLFETSFSITGDNFNYPPTSESDERIVKQLCAGLDISEAQFAVLAEQVMTQFGESPGVLPCSLQMVSALYRLTMLPRWMGLSFAEGAALYSLLGNDQAAWKTLAGVPQLAALGDDSDLPTDSDILDVLMALDSAADWSKTHSQSWIRNYLVLQDSLAHPVPTTNILNVITSINQQLPAALLTEADFDATGVPAPAGPEALTSGVTFNLPKAVAGSPPQSTGSGWMGALSSLVDPGGLVLPVSPDADATVYETLHAAVTAVVEAMTFDASVTLTPEQIADALTTVIFQALLTQNGIADSALAQLLNTTQSLSTFLLRWASDSEYRLLSDTLELNGISTPTTIPDPYLQALYQLGRRASLVAQYHLTPATLHAFLANPNWFGVSNTALTLTLLYRLSRYADWLSIAGKEDAVLAYLGWVNGGTPPDVGAAATALADLLGWDSSEVQDAAARFGTSGLALTVTDVDGVMRLQTLSEETGLSVAPLVSTGALTLSSAYSEWQAAGESLIAAQGAR
nr:28.1 kDa virulence protein [Paraburkholderia busanensis]